MISNSLQELADARIARLHRLDGHLDDAAPSAVVHLRRAEIKDQYSGQNSGGTS